MLEVSVVFSNGKYTVTVHTMERPEPNNPRSDYKHYERSLDVSEGEEAEGSYITTEWSYLRGVENHSRSYRISVADGEDVLLSSCATPIIRARIYLGMGEYQRVDEIIEPLLNFNFYLYIDKEAHELEAVRYEYGLGREKNLDLAFRHYLLSLSQGNIMRFMEMGYGEGAPIDDYKNVKWEIYHSLMMLYHMGERELGYREMCHRANSSWCYEWSDKESRDEMDVEERRVSAMARRQASEWIIERCDREMTLSDKLTLFLGAYYAFCKCGSEDYCTYYDDDSKIGYTRPNRAIDYLKEAADSGESLAIRALELITEIKAEG